MTDIARLRIQIDDVKPPVVRDIEVPLSIRLDDLHFVLQVAIGWQNCHPFEFRLGDTAWGLVDRDTPETNPLPAEEATLQDLAALSKTFKYNYVFGEDWQHTMQILDVSCNQDSAAVVPKLLAGEGRCPPADIGGPSGYDVYLSAIADAAHPLHETMIEFDDPDFDASKVDLSTLRRNLANLGKYLGKRKEEPDNSKSAAA
jgi:hypothetical protein